MNIFSNLLDKYRNFEPADAVIKRTISEVVYQYSGVDIPVKNISLQGYNTFLKTTPAAKTELLLKQDIIIRKLEEILGKKAPKQLR